MRASSLVNRAVHSRCCVPLCSFYVISSVKTQPSLLVVFLAVLTRCDLGSPSTVAPSRFRRIFRPHFARFSRVFRNSVAVSFRFSRSFPPISRTRRLVYVERFHELRYVSFFFFFLLLPATEVGLEDIISFPISSRMRSITAEVITPAVSPRQARSAEHVQCRRGGFQRCLNTDEGRKHCSRDAWHLNFRRPCSLPF